jgi:fused signal recognition particle receptor
MFGFFKEQFSKIFNQVTSSLRSLFSGNNLDEAFIKELTQILLMADVGVTTTQKIITDLKLGITNKKITNMQEARAALESYLIQLFNSQKKRHTEPQILLMVGVNGSGKTTFVAKLGALLKAQNKKVLLVAGDTFRAAATQQLQEWATKAQLEVFIGRENQDPSSVIFDATKKFEEEQFDHLLIDTAGRLQTKQNLMQELEKISRIIKKRLPEANFATWLTVDAMLGQNSLDQTRIFNETTMLDGIVVTKLDGTGKGGIVFAIADELHIPILYVSYGESLTAIKNFDPVEYVKGLLE